MWYLALACSPALVDEPAVSVLPQIATVLVVNFETTAAVTTVIEFGETEAYGYVTPATTGTGHHHALLGMPSGTEVHWRIVMDGEPQEDRVSETDLLPPELPQLETVVDEATWDGFLVTSLVGLWQGPVVLDKHGRIVWYYTSKNENKTATIRAAKMLDSSGVAFNMIATREYGDGSVIDVSWEGQVLKTLSVPGLSHDFIQIGDGAIATIQIARQTGADEEIIAGDRLLEVDNTGTPSTVWDAFDWLDPETTGVDRPEQSWTHCNALHYYPDEGLYRLSIRNLETITTIDRASGTPLDYFGGEANDGWVIEDDERPFSYQHNFQWLGDKVVMFDNGYEEYDDTRVVEYALDPATKTASKTWSYHFDPPRWMYALGDVERLEDDSTLISWSVAGRLEQVKDDETIWRVEAPVGSGFSYLSRTPSLYPE